jgi:hypothetical protein
VAHAIHYDLDRAVKIADTTAANVLRGMAWKFKRQVEADGGRPDWPRARRAYPAWAAAADQRRRAS